MDVDEAVDAFDSHIWQKDDFLSLDNENEIKRHLVVDHHHHHPEAEEDSPNLMEDWEQDVLLSNAGLPEMNPLLEIGDCVVDDFQKMLTDWENQIECLQTTNYLPQIQYILPNEEIKTEIKLETTDVLPNSADAVDLSSGSVASGGESNGSSSSPSSSPPRMEEGFESFLENPSFAAAAAAVEATTTTTPPPPPLPATVKKEKVEEETTMTTTTRPCLAGIVISSGPGAHFETYEVLEASTPDQLLEQFEGATSAAAAETNRSSSSSIGPYKKSQIMAAVRNHFSSQLDDGHVPKVVPSQRIKDALPREVMDKIRASSSNRSRTIAIVEPSHRNGKSNATFNQLNSQMFTAAKTRFQDAASSLTRTKQYRQVGMLLTNSSRNAQVNLDHDYCSSSNKTRRNGGGGGGGRAAVPVDFTTFPSGGGGGGLKNAARSKSSMVIKKTGVPIVVSSSSSLANLSARPYVRVSTRSRVVTAAAANLLKPTPLSSASMLRSDNSTLPPRSSSQPHSRKLQRKTIPNAAAGSSGVTERKTAPPPKTTIVRLHVPKSRRRDEKKDSGLESGEVSDASDAQANGGANEDDGGGGGLVCAKYLTTSDSYDDDGSIYDRLPAYIKGIHSSSSSRREQPRRQSSSSSSASSIESSGCKKKEERMATRSMTDKQRQKRRRNRSSSLSSSESEPETSPKKRRRRRSRSPPSGKRSRCQSPCGEKRRLSLGRAAAAAAAKRSSVQEHDDQERSRVIYVGRIAEGTTRADLRKRFQVFGPISDISVHFRDRGDDYGFVTFEYKADAGKAVDRGNDDPAFPKVDICFGGRRSFCKEQYSDLDSMPLSYNGSTTGSVFDSLLMEARAGMQK